MSEHRFYIGQDVVALKDVPDSPVREGNTYTIKSLRQGICKCSPILVDVGFILSVPYVTRMVCTDCNTFEPTSDKTEWYYSKCFAPLDSLCNIEELTEVLSEPLFEVKAISK